MEAAPLGLTHDLEARLVIGSHACGWPIRPGCKKTRPAANGDLPVSGSRGGPGWELKPRTARSVVGRPLEPHRDRRRDTRDGGADILVVDPQKPIIVAATDGESTPNYTAFIPIRGRDDDGFLWVNHEYVSYPISSIAPAIAVGLNGRPTTDLAVLGFSLPTGASLASLTPADRRLLLGEFSYNQGGSAIRIVRANHKARFEVVRDPKNRRLHGLSGLALNAERTDGYQAVIAWGGAPRQQGDLNYVLATGRAARRYSGAPAMAWARASSARPSTARAPLPPGRRCCPPRRISRAAPVPTWAFKKTSCPTAPKPITSRARAARNSVWWARNTAGWSRSTRPCGVTARESTPPSAASGTRTSPCGPGPSGGSWPTWATTGAAATPGSS